MRQKGEGVSPKSLVHEVLHIYYPQVDENVIEKADDFFERALFFAMTPFIATSHSETSFLNSAVIATHYANGLVCLNLTLEPL